MSVQRDVGGRVWLTTGGITVDISTELEDIAAVAADPLPTYCNNPTHGSGRRTRDCRHCLADPDVRLTRRQFAEGYTVTVAGVTQRRKWYPICALAGGLIVVRHQCIDIPVLLDPLDVDTAP